MGFFKSASWALILIFIHIILAQSNRNRGRARGQLLYPRIQTCETGSCYPATGNLLIGRENQLTASSTCGIKKQEKFCIVSHLEGPKKCFWCDSRQHNRYDKTLSHNISNIVDIHTRELDPWWQSENGVENVTIQLDMEAEFHFTHLVINFKTFRPAAMTIERSQDGGRTWQIYRYFAYDCATMFPHIKTDIPRSLSDIICEEKYSSVNPSSGGELIFRVIPPNIPVDDPFAAEVQELVKMTNLRINFLKLHTLGDNLLDKREEIQEKYYYAINHMIVRGSCSCYGHASRCLPLPEKANSYYPPDMVHGQCECTHNTKGLNCNECEDFYNDLPWKPAFGKSQNACKRCNCNAHASSCHFDSAVFELTGNVTGGVCDNCQHNTQGRNCEECIPFFYHDSSYDIQDVNACQPCDCDPRGSLDEGLCDSHTDPSNGLESGRCHCKINVDGRRCDRCKDGFWNFDEKSSEGCQPCTCHALGTIDSQGCNVNTGECTCKRYVTGRDCNQCLPQYWGLSEDRDGCKPCNCDPGGSFDNDCDVITGQCRCRPHVTGRTCNEAEQSYFTGFPDYMVYEAEMAKSSEDAQMVIMEPNRDGRGDSWTGTGYMRTFEGSHLEFDVNNIKTAMDYDIVIRYSPQLPGGWNDIRTTVERLDPVDPRGPCANSISDTEVNYIQLPVDGRSATVYPPVCMEPGKSYKVRLEFRKYDPVVETPSASILIDSIALIPKYEDIGFYQVSPENQHNYQEFLRYRCGDIFHYASQQGRQIPKVCESHLKSIGAYIYGGAFPCQCDPTGSKSYECNALGGQCECKPNVVGRQCDRCAPGTYGFGPNGCIACDCNSLALDNFCDQVTGQCKCREHTYGRVCDQCQIGFWNFPNCQRCECNGHADTCDLKTGTCISCRDFTHGDHCDTCIEGYYGEPRLGYDIPCRPCPCPGSEDSGHSFASRCSLDPRTKDVICECYIGYAGSRCDVCADNYFGDPEFPGGACQACNCSNNVDITRPGNCDPRTGRCLQCLFNTEGEHCEFCKEGYFGDAINQQCAECVCELLGTNRSVGLCDKNTGQCPCLPNVIGLSCDRCKENHWKIASGEGCEPCDCDPIGSYSEQCNEFDGQCDCKSGFGSRRCDQCQANHWGDPNVECHRCECDVIGSATMQCHRNNGSCICLEGIGGNKCDECARGYLGIAPNCSSCGECFRNWNDILEELHVETERMIAKAANIKEIGVQGAYTHEFLQMERALEEIQDILKSTNMSAQELATTLNLISPLRSRLQEASGKLNATAEALEITEQQIKWVDIDLADLRGQMKRVLDAAESLKENATKLQEANVEGALNLTSKAQKQSEDAEQSAIFIVENVLTNSERQCKRALTLYNRSIDEVNKMHKQNKQSLDELQNRLQKLYEKIPELNEKVCGKAEICDETCGGAGCGTCGGISCDIGAVTKANASYELVKKADKTIKDKEGKAEELLRGVAQAKNEAILAKNASEEALRTAEKAKNGSEKAIKESSMFSEKLDKFINTPGAKPSEIRTAAEETLKLNIHREPKQVEDLAAKINNTVTKLTNINDILEETKQDRETANQLKERANEAKSEADNILNIVENVTKALDDAGDAQNRAIDAIQLAKGHINSAEKDLTQIGSESSEAQTKANETYNIVLTLNERLQHLKSQFFKNQLGISEINEEVDAVVKDANATFAEVSKLREQYILAEEKLGITTEKSVGAKERAQRLFDRASQLYVSTNAKEKDLKDLEQWYEEKNRTLQDLNEDMLHLSGKPRTAQIIDKPGKGGSRRTGTRTLLLKLSETETIWILSISSKYSRDDVHDANRVREDNELYERLTTGKSLERKRYAAETQTPHRMEKSKGTMTAEIVKVDSFVNASAWDLYDTYVELVGDQSEAEKEFQKLIDALLKAKGVALSPDVPFSRVPFEEQVKKLFAQDNFKYALLVTERLLASNRFQTEQSLFKKCIKNKYEDAEQTAFKYEARELWRCERKSGEATPLSVTAMDWNPADADMLAAGYGDLNRASESCGKVCVWSSKNPVHPERELHFPHPVTAVAFSRTWPNVLAVACRNGDLHVADVSADGGHARTMGRDKIRCRHGALWKIEWIANGSLAEKPEELLAVGEGGILMRYTFPDDGESSAALLQLNYMSTVETLYARRANKPEATKQTREISKVKKVFVKHNFSGLWFSVASDGKTCYISTKEGVVIKVKMSFNCRMDDVFPAHNGPVYNVEVSPFTDLIYFTSGADWCLRIWMEGIPEPLITLKLKSSVASAKWSPSIATLIGLVSEAEFSLWDIARSVFLPSRVVRFEGEDFSTLLFSPSGTNVVLGDCGGLIRVLHLSQLPRQPFLQKEALVAAIKKGLFNNEDLHAKFMRQVEVNRKLLKTEIRVPLK